VGLACTEKPQRTRWDNCRHPRSECSTVRRHSCRTEERGSWSARSKPHACTLQSFRGATTRVKGPKRTYRQVDRVVMSSQRKGRVDKERLRRLRAEDRAIAGHVGRVVGRGTCNMGQWTNRCCCRGREGPVLGCFGGRGGTARTDSGGIEQSRASPFPVGGHAVDRFAVGVCRG